MPSLPKYRLNHRQAPPIDGAWAAVGTFEFAAGEPALVEVGNGGTDGQVIVDAVQFLPTKQPMHAPPRHRSTKK